MSPVIYQPRTDLPAKLRRRAARYLARQPFRASLDRGLVSLSFDDCPYSVLENALPLIEAKGWRATIYASLGLCGTTNHLGRHMCEDDIVATHAAGHEIGDHTFSHMDGLQAGPEAVLSDIAKNRAGFEALGLPPARTFAYPYGEVTPSLKRALHGEFELLRGIHAPSGDTLDLGLAASGRLYSNTVDETLDLIGIAARDKSWLILFGHDVRDTPSDFGCSPAELSRVIDAISANGLDVLPVGEALRKAAP